LTVEVLSPNAMPLAIKILANDHWFRSLFVCVPNIRTLLLAVLYVAIETILPSIVIRW
jgi:hypothetical protein